MLLSHAQAPSGFSEVRRQRLLDRLRRPTSATVVAVVGAAGSGKSTVVRQWLADDERPRVVMHLAPHLDDAGSLGEALVAALEAVGPRSPETRAIATGTEPTFSSLLVPEVSRLAGTRATPYLLVMDDVHLLQEPACQRLVEALCEGVPQGSQVALLSRGPLPGAVGRWRAEGRLLEIRPADLALDTAEAASLFDQQGLALSESQVTAAVMRTEGWAVALYLCGLAMRDSGAHGAVGVHSLPTGADRYVVDYLRASVLSSLDDDTRRFLLETSILEELTAERCDAVTGRSDAARMLATLQDRIALVIPLDHERQRYRYHHLFGEALRAEVRTAEPERLAELHRRAAHWYDREGRSDPAVRHAKAAGDMALTSRLVWRGIVPCIASGLPDRLCRWLEGIPAADVAADPYLSLASAWSGLQSADAAVMNRWRLQAETHAGPGWRSRIRSGGFPADLATLMAVVGQGGLPDVERLGLDSYAGLPADSPFRAAAAFLAGVALTLQRDLDAGGEMLLEAGEIAEALGVHIVAADSLSWRGMLAMLSGDWDHGTDLIERASSIIHEAHLDRLATSAHCITAQALALAVRGRRQQAARTLATARQLTVDVRGIAPWFHVVGRLVQARTAVLLGDGATARALIRQARDHLTPDLSDSMASDLLESTESALGRLTSDVGSGGVLTNAELRVLQFMPTHLSFPEIGEHLFLSRNTVKTHALSIYRKLGVSSRTEAVGRARELGLLDSVTLD